jgi:hypothetical protein
MSEFEFDQHYFARTRQLQAEAAAEEQAMLRQLAMLRQQLSKRMADKLRQLGEDRQTQIAEMKRRYATKPNLLGRGNGYGIEESEDEEGDQGDAQEGDKPGKEDGEPGKEAGKSPGQERDKDGTECDLTRQEHEPQESKTTTDKLRQRREELKAEALRQEEARREALRREEEAREEAARRRVIELAARRKREEEETRRTKMRERRMRDDQAGWRVRAINLDVANNIRYVDVPWPISNGTSSYTSITSQAGINVHLASITPEAVRSFLNGVAEIDIELQDRKDGATPDPDEDRLEMARRRAIRDAIRIFHPDKFYHRVLPRVRQAERGKVREGVERTSRVLSDLLATSG